mgnify:CR=1 FL=1|jgi:hypothetical protein
MFKYIKEWFKDYQYAMQELEKDGHYVFYYSGGSVCFKVDRNKQPKLTTHINTTDDKLNTLPRNDTKS